MIAEIDMQAKGGFNLFSFIKASVSGNANTNIDTNTSKFIKSTASNYTDLKDIEDNLGSAIYNRFDKIIHFNDLSVESKMRIGQIAFEKYEKDFNYHLNEATKQRLEESYTQCDNVRQIQHIIENTFALSTILSRIKK